MADFSALIASIRAQIRANGRQLITGPVMQASLLEIIDAVNAAKQDIIADLADIRAGALLGSTAYQKPEDGIPFEDLTHSVQVSLENADNALKPDPAYDGQIPVYNENGYIEGSGITPDIVNAKADASAVPLVFVAEYGTTTFEEITDAINAGKAVICIRNNVVYNLVGTISAGGYVFYTLNASASRRLICNTNSTWSLGAIELQRVENLVQNIGGGAADKYPSTAAVKAAIDALGSRISGMPYPLGWFVPAWDDPDDPFNTPLPNPGLYTQEQLYAYGITESVFFNMTQGRYAGIKQADDGGESEMYAAFLSGVRTTGDVSPTFARFSLRSGNIWTIGVDKETGNYFVTSVPRVPLVPLVFDASNIVFEDTQGQHLNRLATALPDNVVDQIRSAAAIYNVDGTGYNLPRIDNQWAAYEAVGGYPYIHQMLLDNMFAQFDPSSKFVVEATFGYYENFASNLSSGSQVTQEKFRVVVLLRYLDDADEQYYGLWYAENPEE